MTLLIALALIAADQAIGIDSVSADEYLQRARELQLKARQKHCEKVGERIADCFSDTDRCDDMRNSIAWFSGEYGETPELACSTDNDFLTEGAN